jgi:hypothetical protein
MHSCGTPSLLFAPWFKDAATWQPEPIDIQQHATLSSTLVRLAQRIGINRVARDVAPDLHRYLEAKAEAAE